MSYGIRLRDVPDTGTRIRLINPWDGYWLAAFDPDAYDGLGRAEFTAMDGDAMRFDTFEEAKSLWATQSTVRPTFFNMNGTETENRPLACVSIIVDELPD